MGNPNTNAGRDRPYDVLLADFSYATNLVPVVIGAQTFSNGLVFDSRVFTPLSAVAPVLSADSGLNQHMAVLKDFRIAHFVTNRIEVPTPVLVLSGTNSIRWQAAPGIIYTVQRSTTLTNWANAAQFAAMFRSGKRPDGSVIKVMPFESLREVNDTDVQALYAFLKTAPAKPFGQR